MVLEWVDLRLFGKKMISWVASVDLNSVASSSLEANNWVASVDLNSGASSSLEVKNWVASWI